jgi:hypothetical protein
VHVTDWAVMCVSAGFRETLSANVFPMVSGSRKVQAKLSSPHMRADGVAGGNLWTDPSQPARGCAPHASVGGAEWSR